MKTKISKGLLWLEKYLLTAKSKMPLLDMPRAIRSFKPHLKKEHLTLGNCSIEDKTITLATHSITEKTVKGKKKYSLTPLSHFEILETFAHELSHFAYRNHGYEQEWYALTIFNTFGLKETCPHCHGKGKIPAMYRND